MRFRHIAVKCECGRVPSSIQAVGLTAAHQLVLHWKCRQCRKLIYVLKDLADCWKGCPEVEPDIEPEYRVAAEDSRFLKSIGIAAW